MLLQQVKEVLKWVDLVEGLEVVHFRMFWEKGRLVGYC